jgi:ribosome-associated protein
MRLSKLATAAVTALEDIKARDIMPIDVSKITSLCDTMIIATAESSRQTKALAGHVREAIRKAGGEIVGSEGEGSGDWVLVDAGQVIIHIMQPAVRAYYKLEELWSLTNRPEKVDNGIEKLVKAAAKKPGKKPLAKKATARKTPTAKSAIKKPAAKKTAVKAATKPAAKKAAVKKPAAKKTTTV